MAWTLCSKDDVIAIHPITESELNDSWSTFVESLIIQHMGNPYLGSPTVITDEYHNGDGSDVLFVRKPPILSVSELYLNGATLLASDYVVFTNYVQLKNMTFTKDRLNVKITYQSGVASSGVPGTVKFAAAMMIVAIINYRGRMGADSSIRWAAQPVEEGERTPNVNIGLMTHLRAIMKATLRRDKVRVS